jgi:hypothetical protein
MKKTPIRIVIATLLVLLICHPGSGLNSDGIVRLKKAGVSDKTIEIIVREKAIETGSFSVQEIVDMKTAGIGEETIQMVVKERSFLKNSEPIVYGKDIRTLKFTTVKDVIELKNAGVSDEVIQAILTVVADSTDSERKEALDLLEDMNIRIDLRDD